MVKKIIYKTISSQGLSEMKIFSIYSFLRNMLIA